MSPSEFALDYHSLVFSNRCHERKGMEFQHFFEDIMAKHDPSFVAVKPHGRDGDWKDDGWLPGSGTLFQVFSPDSTKVKDIVDKVKEDFDGGLKKWAAHLKEWVFVYSEHNALPAKVLSLIEDLRKAHPHLTLDTWSRETLWRLVAALPLHARTELLGVVPSVSDILTTTAAEVQTLLKFVAKQDAKPAEASTSLLDLIPKLDLNELGPRIRDLISPGLAIAKDVAAYLSRHPDPDFNPTISQCLATLYQKLRTEYPGDPEQVFFALIQSVQSGAPDPAQQLRYFWAATGIVSHYFELCDIFESLPRMILPDKHLPVERSLLSLGAELLQHLRQPRSVSALWGSVRQVPGIGTFHHFTLALTLLYTIGAVDLVNDLILARQK